jgi:ABC-type Fe3+-hydroxamate transport system substrate-binding protein
VFSGSSPARVQRARAFVIACLSAAAAHGAPVDAQVAAARIASAPITVRDDAGRTVVLPRAARRIVSLIPSATETLVAIGAREALVGRTRYDTAAAVRGAVDVGGGLDPDLERIRALRPDLVIVWASSSQKGVPAQLERLGIPTVGVRVEDTAGVFRTHATLGRLTGREAQAAVQAARLRAELAAVAAAPVTGAPRVLYLLFGEPPLSVGRTSYVHELLQLAGARNVFADQALPFPQVSVEAIVARDPDAIILPVGTDGARIEARLTALRTTPGYRDLRAVRLGRVVRIDADLVNRPGPALGTAVAAIRDSLRRVLGGR